MKALHSDSEPDSRNRDKNMYRISKAAPHHQTKIAVQHLLLWCVWSPQTAAGMVDLVQLNFSSSSP